MTGLYFSHPEATYATPEALEVLRALHREYPDYTIVNPEDFTPHAKWISCRNCMEEFLENIFFPKIAECEIFSIWAPMATCRIECELHYAWQLGKPCIFISYFAGEIDFEDLTLKEYHAIESQEVIR